MKALRPMATAEDWLASLENFQPKWWTAFAQDLADGTPESRRGELTRRCSKEGGDLLETELIDQYGIEKFEKKRWRPLASAIPQSRSTVQQSAS